jgi:hypothetical protein|tara:strand:+ start:2417 stop:3373 length:957 start_codon:yes stop_codon:yes gene_type:complete
MAQPTGVTVTFSSVGLREDLENVIYDISPTETPFMSMGGRSDAIAVNHEWQTDSLAAAADNFNEEGSTLTAAEAAATARVGNICQISLKTSLISGTLDAVSKAGRKQELAYQMSKRAKELKRDMERALVGVNVAKIPMAGDGTVRKLASLPTWVNTNISKAGNGANGAGAGAAARTDGTGRAFTETLLKAAIVAAYNSGADTKYLMMAPAQKQTFSNFVGVGGASGVSNFTDTSDQRIIGGMDIYVSDFGEMAVVPNRFQRSRDVWLLDPEYYGVAYLRPFEQREVASTSDGEQRAIICEYTLVVKNEAALGAVYDLS